MNPKPGDKVRISTVKEVIEGIMLESPDADLFLVKLKSGYNIGIKKEDVTNIVIIKEKPSQKIEISIIFFSVSWVQEG